MTKHARGDIAAISLIMVTLAILGAMTFIIAEDISRVRRIVRWERAAKARADFDAWEGEI